MALVNMTIHIQFTIEIPYKDIVNEIYCLAVVPLIGKKENVEEQEIISVSILSISFTISCVLPLSNF